jgi:hypothetical protein
MPTIDSVRAFCEDAGIKIYPQDAELGVLAKRVGCSAWHLYSVFTGRARPSVDLAKALQEVSRGAIPAAQLLGIHDPEEDKT